MSSRKSGSAAYFCPRYVGHLTKAAPAVLKGIGTDVDTRGVRSESGALWLAMRQPNLKS